MAERQAHFVAAAVVERVVVSDAFGVCGDAADAVGRGGVTHRADSFDGDVLAGSDAEGRLGLLGGAGGGDSAGGGTGGFYGVIYIADGGCGRRVVGVDSYGVEADVGGTHAGGGEEDVCEYECVAVAPSLQTTGVVRFAGERTSEGAASDGEFALETVADDATQVASVIILDADIGSYEAVLYGVLHACIIATGEAN